LNYVSLAYHNGSWVRTISKVAIYITTVLNWFRKVLVLESIVTVLCFICSPKVPTITDTRYGAAVVPLDKSTSMEWMIGQRLQSAILVETNHAFMFAIQKALVVS